VIVDTKDDSCLRRGEWPSQLRTNLHNQTLAIGVTYGHRDPERFAIEIESPRVIERGILRPGCCSGKEIEMLYDRKICTVETNY
jgi:hypothetical protein